MGFIISNKFIQQGLSVTMTCMQTEFEATYYPVEPKVLRGKLKKLTTQNIKPLTTMHRAVFKSTGDNWNIVRLRNEGDKTTLT